VAAEVEADDMLGSLDLRQEWMSGAGTGIMQIGDTCAARKGEPGQPCENVGSRWPHRKAGLTYPIVFQREDCAAATRKIIAHAGCCFIFAADFGVFPSRHNRRRRVARRIDAIDWHILRELQDDGRITNVELSQRVGISAPPCLRRVRSLEEEGIIKGYRALLEEKKLGFDLMAFAMVHLISQAEADLSAFAAQVERWPLVRACWMLSGETDFILLCVAPDLRTFQNFVLELTGAPNVRNVKTALTLKQTKDAAVVPMEGVSP
jgi:DNA-binding Lrp family transcriptional regulator